MHDSHRRRTLLCMLGSVWTVCGHFTVLLVQCCDSDSGEWVTCTHIGNIPTSISVKWESGPECPSSDCGHDLQCYSYW